MNALDQIRQKIRQHHLIDERILVPELINLISLQSTEKKEIALNATELVEILRLDKNPGVMEVFLAEYGLSNDEGISLMCLAEALLRVPDVATIDSLIKDKLTNRGWVEHIGNSESTKSEQVPVKTAQTLLFFFIVTRPVELPLLTLITSTCISISLGSVLSRYWIDELIAHE